MYRTKTVNADPTFSINSSFSAVCTHWPRSGENRAAASLPRLSGSSSTYERQVWSVQTPGCACEAA